MATLLSSWILFYSSFFPLYVALFIKNYDEVLKSTQLKQVFIFIALTHVLSMLLLWFFLKHAQNATYTTLKVTNINNKNSELINYLLVYIVPFLTLDITSINDWLSFIFLFLLIGYIYTNNRMLHINPILNLSGFNIYSITTTNGVENILISRKKLEEIIDKEVKSFPLTNFVYLHKA